MSSAQATHVAAPPRNPRLAFIDALRLLATFQMVQGHTLDAVLDQALRRGLVFEVWQRARGLTAVAFLVAAGLAFAHTTFPRLERHRSSLSASRVRFLRALRLIALGYLLHLPIALVWTANPDTRMRILAEFLGVDVLQCIGVCLLLSELLVRAIASASLIATTSALLGIAAVGLAPWTHAWPSGGEWAALVNYATARGGSIFPLLPWAGHFLLGVALGQWAAPAWSKRLMLAAAAALGLASVLTPWPQLALVATHAQRFGTVTLLCGGLHWLLGARRLPAWMERITAHTLVIYVFHILLVYGAGVGLAAVIGPTLPWSLALAVTALVLALSAGVTRAFDA